MELIGIKIGNSSISVKRKNVDKIPNIDKKIEEKYAFCMQFILRYAALFPKNISETPPPKPDFVMRHINGLLSKREALIFDDLLDGNSLATKLKILNKTAECADFLGMDILFQKIAAIIAMLIKDKTLEKIENALLGLQVI